MASVLVLGIDPRVLPGTVGEALSSGLEAELNRFAGAGIEAAMTLVALDGSTLDTVVAALARHSWDVVVVGGGIRKPEPLLTFFEQVVNLIRRHAPQAAVAFNTSGGDSVEAAQRWL